MGGRTYGEVLQLDTLLTMQESIADVPDTLFFIAAHQITELWFMVALHELELARSAMDADDLREACYRLRRVARIENVLLAQLPVLETLSPRHFAVIRERLGASSGFQSAQFREIEFLSGLKERRYLSQVDVSPAERGRPDLTAVTKQNTDGELQDLIEGLLDHDEGLARWRARHALMVERIIGYKPGTGGSEGVAYLQSTTGKRFFPQLWQIRSAL